MPAHSKKQLPLTRRQNLTRIAKKPVVAIKAQVKDLQSRRPHRSFKMTRKRDYNRSLVLPGYMKFTREVHKTLWSHRKVFFFLVAFYSIALVVSVGITSQDSYTSLTKTLRDTGSQVFQGDVAKIGDASALIAVIATTGLSVDSLTEGQQVYVILLTLLVWLTTLWLLRNLLANNKVKMREGLYNAGAPIVPTFLLAFVLVVQLLPVALAIIAYSAASSTGLLNSGVEAMLFWIAAGLLTLMSLYWISSTFFALIVISIPGTYPLLALRYAGDLVVGRRIRLLLRLLWMGLCIIIGWAIVMVPVILIDAWIKGLWTQIEWLPIIPIAVVILSPLTVVWVASYVYLLYRKFVEDDAQPA
ncbi:MAG: hypothetical protein JWM52_195 [Candidatus Saccharibacteria bacterium]|nr:hypothetical protein [Candidatus Saccharibacteria bacterium]